MNEAQLRQIVRQCLLACDQHALERVMVGTVLTMRAEAIERIVTEELSTTPHDVHAWWEGPCNCNLRIDELGGSDVSDR